MVISLLVLGGLVMGTAFFVAGGGVNLAPEYWMAMSGLPLIGMSVNGNGAGTASFQDARETAGIRGSGQGMVFSSPMKRRPLSHYVMFVPCGFFEFVAGLGHGAVYHEVIQFGKSMFLARVPVIGEVVKAIYPQLSLQTSTRHEVRARSSCGEYIRSPYLD